MSPNTHHIPTQPLACDDRLTEHGPAVRMQQGRACVLGEPLGSLALHRASALALHGGRAAERAPCP